MTGNGGKFGSTFPGWLMIQPLATILVIFLGNGFICGRVEDGDDRFYEIKYNIWKLVQTSKDGKHNEVSTLVDWNDYCHKDGPVLQGNDCDSNDQTKDHCEVCGLVRGMRGVAISMFSESLGISINFFLACLPKSWLRNQGINVWWMIINLPILFILMITFLALGAAVPLDKGPLGVTRPAFNKEWDTRYVWHSAPFINLIVSAICLLFATCMTFGWKKFVLEEDGGGLTTHSAVTPVAMGN